MVGQVVWSDHWLFLCLGGTLGGWSISSTTLGGAWSAGLERLWVTLGDAWSVGESASARLERSSKSAVSCRKATLVGLPVAKSGVEDSWTSSSIATVALFVAKVVGILNLVGRKVTVSEFWVALVVLT